MLALKRWKPTADGVWTTRLALPALSNHSWMKDPLIRFTARGE